MTSFNIKIEGLDELTKKLGNVGPSIRSELKTGMVTATTLIQNEARAINPGSFKNQTGNLRRSILKGRVTWDYGEVGTNEAYAQAVEFGSKAHTIVPKGKRFLAFKGRDGRMIFARKVNHPGSKPYPYMRPAFEKNLEQIGNIFGTAILRVVRALA
jgi:HK97 gp10 family phage protein